MRSHAIITTAATRLPSPQAYTPRHLAEKILTSKSALEGERKQLTVLFADLKGSMELLADRDPEEARKLLDPVLEHMMEAVHRYEGTVNQVMGDGIMALFGAPLAHEDHAVRACYAALRMQESVKRYAEEVQRASGLPIQIRVGLNAGEVVVRSIGSDLHMDYTAVGQTTHLAARMEQMAMAGSILITGDTLRLAESYVQVKHLGGIPVKGGGAGVGTVGEDGLHGEGILHGGDDAQAAPSTGGRFVVPIEQPPARHFAGVAHPISRRKRVKEHVARGPGRRRPSITTKCHCCLSRGVCLRIDFARVEGESPALRVRSLDEPHS